jgi:hypothetical protein
MSGSSYNSDPFKSPAVPSSPDDLTNRAYADTHLYGLPITTSPPTPNQVPTLNGTSDGWVFSTASSSVMLDQSLSYGFIPPASTDLTLVSLNLPANSLSADGQQAIFNIAGTCQCPSAGITLRAKFSGVTLVTTPPLASANVGSSWIAGLKITRYSSPATLVKLIFEFSVFVSDMTSLATNRQTWIRNGDSTSADFSLLNSISITATTAPLAQMAWLPGTSLIKVS